MLPFLGAKELDNIKVGEYINQVLKIGKRYVISQEEIGEGKWSL
jgi:hypothetical protein